jgi:hypothetical protein
MNGILQPRSKTLQGKKFRALIPTNRPSLLLISWLFVFFFRHDVELISATLTCATFPLSVTAVVSSRLLQRDEEAVVQYVTTLTSLTAQPPPFTVSLMLEWKFTLPRTQGHPQRNILQFLGSTILTAADLLRLNENLHTTQPARMWGCIYRSYYWLYYLQFCRSYNWYCCQPRELNQILWHCLLTVWNWGTRCMNQRYVVTIVAVILIDRDLGLRIFQHWPWCQDSNFNEPIIMWWERSEMCHSNDRWHLVEYYSASTISVPSKWYGIPLFFSAYSS